MGSVSVTFVGVCTHFRNIAPGVPHRVVLADASAFRFGISVIGDEHTPSHATYYTMPHFPVLRMRRHDVQQRLHIPGIMEHGNVYSGVRLSIPNAVDAGICYEEGFDSIAHLGRFAYDYAFSPEVVLGGRAAVYFDLFSAVMTPWPIVDQAVEVTAVIQTIGPPELLATPFFGGSPRRFPLLAEDQCPDETVGLWVANQGMDCETGEAGFDFLLHYLTSRNGIPRRLTQATPGMNPSQTLITSQSLDEGARALTKFDYPAVFDSPCLKLEGLLTVRRCYQPGAGFLMKTPDGEPSFVASLACSNSQYP